MELSRLQSDLMQGLAVGFALVKKMFFGRLLPNCAGVEFDGGTDE